MGKMGQNGCRLQLERGNISDSSPTDCWLLSRPHSTFLDPLGLVPAKIADAGSIRCRFHSSTGVREWIFSREAHQDCTALYDGSACSGNMAASAVEGKIGSIIEEIQMLLNHKLTISHCHSAYPTTKGCYEDKGWLLMLLWFLLRKEGIKL